MQNLDFELIFNFIKFILALIFIFYIFIRIEKQGKKYLDLKRIDFENDKMELLLKIEPKNAEKEIDEYIKNKLNEYIVKNILINKIEFIRKEQIDKMVRELDKEIILNISELYIFYIKLLTNIKDENDLLIFIDSKVKDHVLQFVTEYNKPK